MRVLFIHCTYRFKGGEDTVVAEELKLLQGNGIEARLLEFNNDKSAMLNLLQMTFNFSSYRKTRHILRSFKPDIVHVHNLHFAASPSVLWAVKKEKIPLVMTLHNFRLLCPSGILFYQGKPFMHSLHQSFPWQAALKGVYRNSRMLTFWMSLNMLIQQWLKVWDKPDRYLVLSEHAANIFQNSKMHFLPGKMIIKPNFCYAPPSLQAVRGNYFLYVGRLTEEKGVRMMMQAFAKTGYELAMAGDGPLRDEVVAFSAKHPNIRFIGSLQKEAVFHWLHHCTALVFPSVWFEGMPLTIIEAFACGTPVIASRLGAMETMITDRYNGLHFEPGSEAGLAEKLTEWQQFKDSEQTRYRQNADNSYQQWYTPEKNRQQLLQLYESLISSHPVKTPEMSGILDTDN